MGGRGARIGRRGLFETPLCRLRGGNGSRRAERGALGQEIKIVGARRRRSPRNRRRGGSELRRGVFPRAEREGFSEESRDRRIIDGVGNVGFQRADGSAGPRRIGHAERTRARLGIGRRRRRRDIRRRDHRRNGRRRNVGRAIGRPRRRIGRDGRDDRRRGNVRRERGGDRNAGGDGRRRNLMRLQLEKGVGHLRDHLRIEGRGRVMLQRLVGGNVGRGHVG